MARPTPTLYAARIFVSDLDAARQFYGETIGLRVAFDMGDAVGFEAGALLIVEREYGNTPESLVGRFLGLSLQVDDVAATVDRLETAAVRIVGRPQRQPWGGILAHVADPSSNTLSLVQLLEADL